MYTWFLPSGNYTDKHVVAILINHTLGALPTVFPRTGCKMKHSKEIPHIAANDPLPKPGLRKIVISLLESHVITLPATFLNVSQLFFLHWLPTNTAHKTRVTHSILLCQTILRKGCAGVIWCHVCYCSGGLQAIPKSAEFMLPEISSWRSDCMCAQLWLFFSHKVIFQFMWKSHIAHQIQETGHIAVNILQVLYGQFWLVTHSEVLFGFGSS